MQVYKFRLKFTSPLHISARGVQFEQVSQIIHSDTLFGAVVNIWNLLYPEDVDKLFKQTDKGPPFLLSSAFPYFNDWEFYPRPLSFGLPVSSEQEINPDLGKRFKRVQFLESQVLFNILKGRELPLFNPDHTLGDGKFWLVSKPMNEDHYILRQEEISRAVIDRYSNSTNLYFVSELYFEEGGGLFFLVHFRQADWQDKFSAVLRLLGDEGLGLDRSSGKGLFELLEPVSTFDLPQPSKPSRFLTLSLFHPTEIEIGPALLEKASYELVHRSGWITTSGRATPYRRQTLTMFAEGSVFTGAPDKMYGDMPLALKESFIASDLQHQVYRYGYAFPVGMA